MNIIKPIFAQDVIIPSAPGMKSELTTGGIGGIISLALPYIYVFAGIALLVMIILGGFTLMTAAGDPAKTKEGYGRISSGLVGFLIIFISYFIIQILEIILAVKIL